MDGKFISSFQWSMQNISSDGGSIKESFSFVLENNIYIGTVSETGIKYQQITDDGAPEEIFNGHTDWAYEEEIFNTDKASYWSKGGNYLAFVKFNDTLVKYFPYTTFTVTNENYYPNIVNVRYPNSGTPNPLVSIHIFDKRAGKVFQVSKYAFPADDLVLQELVWINDEILLFRQLNRIQSIMHLTKIDVSQPQFHENPVIIKSLDNGKSGGWIDIGGSLTGVQIGGKYFYLDLENDRTGFNHIYMASLEKGKEGTEPLYLTGLGENSRFEVIKVYGFEEINRKMSVVKCRQ